MPPQVTSVVLHAVWCLQSVVDPVYGLLPICKSELRFGKWVRLRPYIRPVSGTTLLFLAMMGIRAEGTQRLCGLEGLRNPQSLPPPVRPFCHHSSLSSNRELKSRRVSAQPHAVAVRPCRLSYVPPRVSSAQAMRAILLAKATAATFLCRRAATLITQRLRGSSLRPATLSTARAP